MLLGRRAGGEQRPQHAKERSCGRHLSAFIDRSSVQRAILWRVTGAKAQGCAGFCRQPNCSVLSCTQPPSRVEARFVLQITTSTSCREGRSPKGAIDCCTGSLHR